MLGDEFLGLYAPLTNGETTSAEMKASTVFIAGLALAVGLMAGVGSMMSRLPMGSWFFGFLYFGMCVGISGLYLGGMKALHWHRGTQMETIDWVPAYGLSAVGAMIGLATLGFYALAAFKEVMGLGTGGFIFSMMGMVLGAWALLELGAAGVQRYRNRNAPLGDRSDEAFQHLLTPEMSPRDIPMQTLRANDNFDIPRPYYSDEEDEGDDENASSQKSFRLDIS